ncbi:MAG: 50S ribosomal protein L18 [Candidatus Omnitrophica bacterium]|nr:50S ribosomal protein L18 [Candidatus Omnitrophota bacterium]
MKDGRINRHRRIRKKVIGSKDRPRLSVYRSLTNLYAQIIDDENCCTVLTCSTLQKEIKEQCKNSNIKSANILGELIAKKAQEKGITSVVFDRGGYLYHGKIKAVAEAARKGGLQF